MKLVALAVALSACTLLGCGQDKPASTLAPAPGGDSYMPGANVGDAPPETTKKDDAAKK